MTPIRVLVVGGGHAALPTIKHANRLREAGATVTVISEGNHLFYSGRTPEYIGGGYTLDEVRIDLEMLCERSGATFVADKAVGLDLTARRVTTAGGLSVEADLIAVDVGGVNPPLPSAPSESISTRPLSDLTKLRVIVDAMASGEVQNAWIGIVGGGAAGCELALNASARIAGSTNRIAIFEPAERLLPTFSPSLATHVAQCLRSRGVEVHLNTRIESFSDGHLIAGARTFAADHVVMATGSTGQHWIRESSLRTDAAGYALVQDSLQTPAHPWLFVAGDGATLLSKPRLMKVGVHAVKQGPVLRSNLIRAVEALKSGQQLFNLEMDTFRPYPAAPLILSTGGRDGILTSGRLWLRGSWALNLKHRVDGRWIRRYQ